jgi:hypothetical protein
MSEPDGPLDHAILAWGPSGPRTVIVDSAIAAQTSTRDWRWIGGRVVSVGEGDDFSTMLDLAELATGVAGARPADPRSLDYRARMLGVRAWPDAKESE